MSYWSSQDLAGGPISSDLNTVRVKAIKTPIMNLVRSTPTYGYFEIKRIVMDTAFTHTFYDVWLLASEESDVPELTKLASQPSDENKCCMIDNGVHGGATISDYTNGIGRVIKY